MPESAGSGVVHFVPFYISEGNIMNWCHNSLLSFFLSKSIPAVGGPR